MAKPTTRAQFKDYCLRRLGWPVIQINVDDDQIEDRIDDALAFFNDYHYDGVEKIYMKHKITEEDISRRWIYAPDAVTFVTGVMPFDDSNSSINMFDLRYQLRLHDLYDFTSVSYVSYEITMQHIRTLNLLFSGTPQFRFNRHHNRLHLDVDWSRDIDVGKYIIVECYRKLVPDTITLTGTVTGNTTSNTLNGYGTKFDQEVLENDFIEINGESKQIRNINSATEITLVGALSTNKDNVSVTFSGVSDIWDDRFLKKYATALIKRQWGENMKKFGGVMMPGGVSLNGKEIYDEAVEEIGKIEEDMFNFNSLPSEIFTG
jgi:sporulation protein YlmC with PRC-barrel domain